MRQAAEKIHERVPTPEEIAMDCLAAIKAIVRRGIVTLLTLRDPDRKYLHKHTAWLFPVVNSAQEVYGYHQYGFEPTPHDLSQMETVAIWLAWVRRSEGDIGVRRIIAWTLGVPAWRLGNRERCSERTIKNRIDRTMTAIIRRFAAADISVEIFEDGPPQALRNGRSLGVVPPYDMVFDKPPGPHGGTVILRKVYVYDKGFMLGGRRWRDGREKAERFLA